MLQLLVFLLLAFGVWAQPGLDRLHYDDMDTAPSVAKVPIVPTPPPNVEISGGSRGGGSRGGGGRGGGGGGRGGGGRGGGGGGRGDGAAGFPSISVPEPNQIYLKSTFVPLQRVYFHAQLKHRIHSDPGVISTWSRQGFASEGTVGRIISTELYQRNRALIDAACPGLVQLYGFIHPGVHALFVTTNPGEANNHRNAGWQEQKSMGYCPSSQSCGATKRLRMVTVTDGTDRVFTTDDYEISVLSGTARFRNGVSNVVCWLF